MNNFFTFSLDVAYDAYKIYSIPFWQANTPTIKIKK